MTSNHGTSPEMDPSTDADAVSDTDAQFGAAVRARRAQLGITLDQLAQASGVSSGALSRVERGLLSASLRKAMAIARGLGSDLSDLVRPVAGPHITRAGEHQRFVYGDTGVERVALAQPLPGLELLQFELPSGAESSHFAAHRAGTREVFHILKGQVRVWSGEESVLLRAGDTAVLSMDTEHRFINAGNSQARFILMVASPLG